MRLMAPDERPPEPAKPGREPLSPAKRKRLEKVFEVASKKAAGSTTANDFDYVSELIGQCMLGEPGNATYVRAFIENLQKKYGDNRKGSKLARLQELGARSALKKAVAQEQWYEVIQQGMKVLAVNPWDMNALLGMAKAANKSGDRDCELVYVEAALKGSPKNATCNRLYALALTDRGLIDQAITFWHRVEQALPNDEEAKRSIASLTVQKQRASGKFDEDDDDTRRARVKSQQQQEVNLEQQLQRKIRSEPDKVAHYLELAQLYLNADRFAEAEKLLAKAYELSKGDNDVREKWEDAQIRALRQKIAHTKDPEAKKRLQVEQLKKELQFYKGRVDRSPNNLLFKYELGYRCMKAKRYQEAIPELQAAVKDPRRRGICMLALGQCFQGIQQYPLAKRHYEAATQEIPDHDGDNKKKALYLLGRLTYALRDLDAAEKHLSALAALDFTYRDVPQLLDKIAKLRENPPKPPEKPPEKKDDQPEANGGGA
jgi:tetratricopeptide (TPR) repeat protein